MFQFSDEELIVHIKDFCHYLFETAEIDKCLSYCSDDISYYNSLGGIDIKGKANLKEYFVTRQNALNTTHTIIYHKYSIQRISEKFAIVHLMAELQGRFLVNSSITLKKEHNSPLICNIHGFITKAAEDTSAVSSKMQNSILQSFFNQVGEWREDNDKLIAQWVYNLTQDTVSVSYLRNNFYNNFSECINFEFFVEKIKNCIPTEEAKQELSAIYNKDALLNRFIQGNLKFKTVFPFIYDEIFVWTKAHNTLYKNTETGDIWCFVVVYDASEELIKNSYSDHYLYSQADLFVQLNTKSSRYTFFPSKEFKTALSALPLSGYFNNDLEVLLDSFVYDDDKDLVRREFNYETMVENILRHNFYSITCRMKSVDGSSKVRYKRIQFFKFSQVPDIVNFACTDITDVYALEMQKNEALTQALDVATNANKAKSLFLASMSHDLRTPMNAILGMTQLAMEDLNNKEQIIESFSIIRQSSEHLLSLVNDVLEMNKIENGSFEENCEPFSVTDECNKILSFYQSEILSRNHTVITDFSNIKHCAVFGDKTKFSRIISNILGNAIKYTLDNGTINFSLSETPSKHSASVAYYTIRVQDSGIGIASQNISDIFHPFYREDNGKSRKIEGLGLGLPIVKAFVDNLGGTISVESELGEGSVFTVQIPYQLNSSKFLGKQRIELTTEQINLKNFSVLLAEDNPVNVLMFKKVLEKCGANVTVAQNGQKAYEAVLKMDIANPFRVIFMDLQMPVMNGFEAAKKIRELPSKIVRQIPIIAVTANAYQEDMQRSREAGMDAHIAKPIKLSELYQVLSELKLLA